MKTGVKLFLSSMACFGVSLGGCSGPDPSGDDAPDESSTTADTLIARPGTGSALLFRHTDGTLAVLPIVGTSPLLPNHLVYPMDVVPGDWTLVGTGDFNKDGHGDLFWERDDGLVTHWQLVGTGAKNINPPQSNAPALPNPFMKPLFGDFNGDGITDVLWQGARPTKPKPGDPLGGGGTLPDPFGSNLTYLTETWTMESGTTVPASKKVGSSTTSWVAAVGQFDGKGGIDQFRRGPSGATFFKLGSTTLDGPNVPSVWVVKAIGDFNGDGTSDIVWHNSATGDVSIWNVQGGAFSGAPFNTNVPFDQWQILGAGDVDGDNVSDLVWRNVNGQVVVWLFSDFGVKDWGSGGFALDPAWRFTGILDTKTRLGAFTGYTYAHVKSESLCSPQDFTITGPLPDTVSRTLPTGLGTTRITATDSVCSNSLLDPYVNIAGMYKFATTTLGTSAFDIMADVVAHSPHCPSSAFCEAPSTPPPPPPSPKTVLHGLKIWNDFKDYRPANGEPIWYGAKFPAFPTPVGQGGKIIDIAAGGPIAIPKVGNNVLDCNSSTKAVHLKAGDHLGVKGMKDVFGMETVHFEGSMQVQLAACREDVVNPVPDTLLVSVTFQNDH
jgi:hypothetical protein